MPLQLLKEPPAPSPHRCIRFSTARVSSGGPFFPHGALCVDLADNREGGPWQELNRAPSYCVSYSSVLRPWLD